MARANKTHRDVRGALAAALVLLAGSAVAQDDQLEEIIVTAQYREQNLQDVPVAVTAFTADLIIRAGIESTQDFVNLTPNMTMDDSFTVGNTFLQVRGVAQINNADSPVAIVVDGVPQNNQKQFKQDLFDIERIEVLKGPQGSLYGRNAIGGAINIVSKAPTNELDGYINVGAGNGGLVKVNGAVSGALVPDKLLYRVSAGYKDFDGVVDNRFLGQEVDFFESKDFRGRLIYNATDNFTAELRLAYSDTNGGCCSDTFVFNPLVGNAPNPTGISNPNNNRFTEPAMNVLGRTDLLESKEITLKFDYEMEQGTLSYIFNDTSVEEDYFADLDFTDGVENSLGFFFTNFFFGGMPVGANQQQFLDVDLTSHELRFTSPGDRRLRFIAGAYFLDTERSLATIGDFDFMPTTPIFDRSGFSGVPFVSLLDVNDNSAWAVFGQMEYDLTDDLELTLGLRYDKDERNHNGFVVGTDVTTSPSKTFSDVQPKVVLTKRLTDQSLVYGSYSRGFRSGGFNGPAIGSPSFDEETLDNFEVGYKSTSADRRMMLNGALFFGKSDNFQFFFVDLVTASQVIANIEEVDIKGAEIELQALVNDDWTLYGTVGLTDAEITKSVARPQDEGNHAPKNQLYTLNLGAEYEFAAGSMEGRARLDYEHRGRKYWHPDNANAMDPFGLLNGRLSFKGERTTVTLWGKNMTDEEYWQDYNSATFSGAFGDIGFLARGATWGIDLEYRFR